MVRHLTLDQGIEGSSPSSPAKITLSPSLIATQPGVFGSARGRAASAIEFKCVTIPSVPVDWFANLPLCDAWGSGSRRFFAAALARSDALVEIEATSVL